MTIETFNLVNFQNALRCRRPQKFPKLNADITKINVLPPLCKKQVVQLTLDDT